MTSSFTQQETWWQAPIPIGSMLLWRIHCFHGHTTSLACSLQRHDEPYLYPIHPQTHTHSVDLMEWACIQHWESMCVSLRFSWECDVNGIFIVAFSCLLFIESKHTSSLRDKIPNDPRGWDCVESAKNSLCSNDLQNGLSHYVEKEAILSVLLCFTAVYSSLFIIQQHQTCFHIIIKCNLIFHADN